MRNLDATAHYRNLVALGRDQFLAAAAPAALVRYRPGDPDLAEGASMLTLDSDGETIEETMPVLREPARVDDDGLEVYPLTKKPGASFPDRITIGRTSNNDVVIVDHSVSRFHAYVRQDKGVWLVADAGSKNGSWLDSGALEPRKERTLRSRSTVRIGDVDLTFFVASDLFAAMGGQ